MKPIRVIALSMLVFCFIGVIKAEQSKAEQSSKPLIPSSVMLQYTAAAKGDSDANEEAYEALIKLHKKHPGSALANTVLGSSEAMRARDSFIPWRQLKYLEKGMSLMDKGVQLLQPKDHLELFEGIPVSLWVRNTAGCTFIELPEQFNRLEMGYQLLQKTLDSKEVAGLPFASKASTYLCAGIAAEKMGEKQAARQFLELIASELPSEDEHAREARSLLQKL
ncbi:hypothetical protein [Pleionea sp. CnH1-48]|uniref:hypothetical protein n=1 Tax=Pleionea sp. CnH1-48 TaxID=2954494 RepID=UPI0020971355|nr:hypothetical protein [Pleionea sp. CnH1-48]MCO7224332.1 hypothetical protein [Pleionea sp. CnH1-48]